MSSDTAVVRDWHPSGIVPVRWRTLVAALLLSGAMVGSVLVLRLDHGTADAYTEEDGMVEILGAIFLLAGAVFAIVGYFRSRGAPVEGWVGKVKPFAYLALALFLFMAAGEELSWGQRLFGFGTPDGLKEINAQGEINLHNLYGDANTKQNVSTRLFQVAWLLFGVLIPLTAAASAAAGRFLRRFLPVAPVWLAFLFIGQQLLWQPVEATFRHDPGAWHATYKGPEGSRFSVETRAEAQERAIGSPAGMPEIMETNVELLLAVGAFCVMMAAPRGRCHEKRAVRSDVKRELTPV